MTITCNICGGSNFAEFRGRIASRCADCGSLERTRILKLVLDEYGMPRSGMRILHLAPERSLAKLFSDVAGEGYDPTDLDPSRYKFAQPRRLDLVAEAANLPSKTYDLVIHSHVLEHLPCNITAVLFHLHRALKDDGLHLCGVPIGTEANYAENLGPMDARTATRRFGQHDHVRRFGALDLQRTLGMVFRIPEHYDIETRFGAETLQRHGIPERNWRSWTGSSHLELRKSDLKLVA